MRPNRFLGTVIRLPARRLRFGFLHEAAAVATAAAAAEFSLIENVQTSSWSFTASYSAGSPG